MRGRAGLHFHHGLSQRLNRKRQHTTCVSECLSQLTVDVITQRETRRALQAGEMVRCMRRPVASCLGQSSPMARDIYERKKAQSLAAAGV